MPTEPKDNLVPNPPPGPARHVLVIGVSQYRHLADGIDPTERGKTSHLDQLSSAARSAALVAEWTMATWESAGLPLGSIRIALSPAPDEHIPDSIFQLLGDGDHSATRNHVEAALLAFVADCRSDTENVALVYVAGHGVQITKEGATVLLEDYGSANHLRELDGAIDMVSVNRGLNGTGFPAKQFWFVDACRQKPLVAKRFESMSLEAGIKLDHTSGVVDSSPIYLSTGSGASAFGIRGGESLFCAALLWALQSKGAAVGPGGLSDFWHVSVNSLAIAVREQVQMLAKLFQAEQFVEITGRPNESLFHEYSETPNVRLQIELAPELALPCNWILKDEFHNKVAEEDDDWRLEITLEAGLYNLEYRPKRPYRPGGQVMNVSPPSPMQRRMKAQL